MSKNVRTFHSCDVCNDTVETDHKPNEWEFIYYGESWQIGAHKGLRDKKFLACDKCLKGERKFFSLLLKLFNPRNPR